MLGFCSIMEGSVLSAPPVEIRTQAIGIEAEGSRAASLSPLLLPGGGASRGERAVLILDPQVFSARDWNSLC